MYCRLWPHMFKWNSPTEWLLHSSIFRFMSLEVCHKYAQIKDIKPYDKLFKPGRLHNEVINSFLFNLTKKHTVVLFLWFYWGYIDHHGKSLRNMWKNEDLTKKYLVLIPFNPTNSHWKLICINLSEATVSVLDPMVRPCQDQDALDVARTILQKKFGIHKFLIKKMLQYSLQRDCINCGVFVCCFAEQIVKGKNLLRVC